MQPGCCRRDSPGLFTSCSWTLRVEWIENFHRTTIRAICTYFVPVNPSFSQLHPYEVKIKWSTDSQTPSLLCWSLPEVDDHPNIVWIFSEPQQYTHACHVGKETRPSPKLRRPRDSDRRPVC